MSGERVFGTPAGNERVFGGPPKMEATTDDSAPSMASSALQGFGQGGTFGFLPWLQAKMQQLGEGVGQIGEGEFERGLSNVGSSLAGLNPTTAPFAALTPDTKDFNVYRQQFANEDKKKREANPITYGGSAFLGGVAVPIPGAGAIKGAGFLKNVGQAMKTGAGMGAAAGLGNAASEGMDLPDAAVNVAKGGALGGAFGGALGGLGYGISKGAEKLRGFSGDKVLQYLGAAGNAVENKKMDARGRPFRQQLAEDAVDSGVMTSFSGPETMVNRLEGVLDSRGNKLDNLMTEIDKSAPQGVDPLDFVMAIEKKISEAEQNGAPEAYLGALRDEVARLERTAAARGQNQTILQRRISEAGANGAPPEYIEALQKQLSEVPAKAESLGNKTSMSLTEANNVFKRPLSAMKGKSMAMQSVDDQSRLAAIGDIYSGHRQGIEKAADFMAGPGTSDTLRATNASLGNAEQMAKLLSKRLQQQGSNRSLSLTDIIGAAGGATFGPAGIAAGLAANKAARGFGGQALAVNGLNASRAMLRAAPAIQSMAGRVGGATTDMLESFMGLENQTPMHPKDDEEAAGNFVAKN